MGVGREVETVLVSAASSRRNTEGELKEEKTEPELGVQTPVRSRQVNP